MDVMRQANECDTQKKHMHKSMHRINCTQWIVEWKNFNHNFDIEQQYAAVFSLIFPLQFDFNIRMHIMWFVDIFFLCVPYTALTKTQPLLSICIARINNNISLCFCEDVFRVKRFFLCHFSRLCGWLQIDSSCFLSTSQNIPRRKANLRAIFDVFLWNWLTFGKSLLSYPGKLYKFQRILVDFRGKSFTFNKSGGFLEKIYR